jgi:hypothetical protein
VLIHPVIEGVRMQRFNHEVQTPERLRPEPPLPHHPSTSHSTRTKSFHPFFQHRLLCCPVSRNNFASHKRRCMVKLSERKIRWIIQQKLGGRGTGELALIQRVDNNYGKLQSARGDMLLAVPTRPDSMSDNSHNQLVRSGTRRQQGFKRR